MVCKWAKRYNKDNRTCVCAKVVVKVTGGGVSYDIIPIHCINDDRCLFGYKSGGGKADSETQVRKLPIQNSPMANGTEPPFISRSGEPLKIGSKLYYTKVNISSTEEVVYISLEEFVIISLNYIKRHLCVRSTRDGHERTLTTKEKNGEGALSRYSIYPDRGRLSGKVSTEVTKYIQAASDKANEYQERALCATDRVRKFKRVLSRIRDHINDGAYKCNINAYFND